MTIMGLLQCTWAHDPERVAKWFARDPERRNTKIGGLLFASKCTTGRRLRKAFGPRCDDIIWENATPVIAGQASGCPLGDPMHVRAALERIKPDVVLAFGWVAREAMAGIEYGGTTINGPHPTGRGLFRQAGVPFKGVKYIEKDLDEMRRLLDEKTKE